MKLQKNTDSHHRHSLTLTGKDIVRLLRFAKVDIPEDAENQATVTVRVPGGADWSNMDLDLRYESTVIVRWMTHDHDRTEEEVTKP